jgi:hypothetical protein
MLALLLTSLTGRPPARLPRAPRGFPRLHSRVIGFADARLEELAARVRRGESGPLLAAPTHEHGWIDALVLVERLRESGDHALGSGRVDFTQALLRLAPDRRSEAHEAASEIPGNAGRIVRWALGGAETPTRGDRKHRHLWLAAGRARNPHESLDDLAVLKLDRGCPDGLTPASYPWHALTLRTEHECHNRVHGDPRGLTLGTEPANVTSADLTCMPTVALHAPSRGFTAYDVHAPWLVQWIAMTWPLNPDPFFAAGARAMAVRMDAMGAAFEPNFAFLEPLLEVDRPWTEMAHLVLWLALAGKDAGARGAALGVLVEAVSDGRAHPAPLSRVLSRLAEGGWLELNRVAGVLGEMARVSSLHAWVAAEILERMIAGLEERPRDLHHGLALLLELETRLGRSLVPDARSRLEPVSGSGQTAELACSLLALSASDAAVLHEARLDLLEGRVARGERWMACSGAPAQ